MGRVKIAPSILSADFSALGAQIEKVESSGADMIHIDVMDGIFAPNITIGPVALESIRPHTKLPFDVHLMIDRPERYLEDFTRAGADTLTVHIEGAIHLNRTIELIKSLGRKAGVAINPHTPVCALDSMLEMVDLVLVMSVNPGFGGQRMIPSTLRKVEALADRIAQEKLNVEIEIDGGINPQTASSARDAGCSILVAGSAIFSSSDFAATIGELRGDARKK